MHDARTGRRSLAFAAILAALASPAARADDLAEPQLAQAIAEKFWDGFDRINDVELKFRSTMKPAKAKEGEAGHRWDKGYYAYKRGGFEFLQYEETEFIGGQATGPVAWTYILTPKNLRGWRDDPETGNRQGAIRPPNIMNFRLPWTPDNFLKVAYHHTKTRGYIATGRYVVRLREGKSGNPQLIAPVTPAKDANDKRTSADAHKEKHAPPPVYVFTLARDHGMSPVKVERYQNNIKEVETSVELAEVIPGIWLAEHGVSRQLPYKKGVEAITSEFWLEPGSLKINTGLKAKLFDAEFPSGTRVWDDVSKRQFTQDSGGRGRVEQLAAVSARSQELAPRQTESAEMCVVANSSSGRVKWVLASAIGVFGISVTGCGVYLTRRGIPTRFLRS